MFIPIEELDIIAIGGLAHRNPGHDIDIRVQHPSLHFDKLDKEGMARALQSINIGALRAMLFDLFEGFNVEELDIGVTIKVNDYALTVLYGNQLTPQEIVEFRYFKWCYYLQRSSLCG